MNFPRCANTARPGVGFALRWLVLRRGDCTQVRPDFAMPDLPGRARVCAAPGWVAIGLRYRCLHSCHGPLQAGAGGLQVPMVELACACTWSTDGGHQPHRSARGSRCGWPICSSWWCTWLLPGGEAMRPRWPAPTACSWPSRSAPTVCRWLSCCRRCCTVRPPGGLCVHLVDRWRPPAAPACTWIALQLAELLSLAPRRMAARPGTAPMQAGAGGLQVPMVELACGRQAYRWHAPAAVACGWIELQQLVVHLVAARWSGHAAELAGADGLHWIALRLAELLSLVLCRVAARPGTVPMLAGADGLQVPMVELACGRQADRWCAPAAPACRWIALQLAELQQLVVRLVAARWSGHAAALAGADGLQVAELLPLVLRRAATRWAVRAPGRPMAATSCAGLQVDRAAADRAAAAGGAPGCRLVARPCGRAGRRRRSAGGRAAAAGAAPCGHPVGLCVHLVDRWRPPAAPVCRWIALRLAELLSLVVHLVAARWSGHAAALARLVVCRCRWSGWPVGARPTDGVHQPRWPACGSRCS